MITKERLEELIEQGSTIYESDFLGVNAVNVKKGDYVEQNGTLHTKEFVGAYDYFYNEKLFETIEEAEWHREFGCIERTERLELPTWEEFLILEKIYSFKSKNNQIVVLFSDNHTIYLEDENWNILREDLTKENYTLACRKAKELFLGEKK